MTPRVSVIVAARDAARTIESTLASVRDQTFTDWEVVLVDDGSADATAELAAAVDPRVRVERLPASGGPGAARNRAAELARGELLAVLDADDLFLPRYLESQIAVHDAAVAAGRRVGAVCCEAEILGPDGNPMGTWSERVGARGVVDIETMIGENVVFGLALCPRAVFQEVGGYDPDNRIHLEDYDLWLRILEAGYAIEVNPETLAVYRFAPTTRSSAVERMATGGELLMDRALARGALTPRQRRLARKRRRMYRVVGRRAAIAAEPGPRRRALLTARAAPAMAFSMLEHPERWRHWLRNGPRSVGGERHAGT